jgi:hypothetical protein
VLDENRQVRDVYRLSRENYGSVHNLERQLGILSRYFPRDNDNEQQKQQQQQLRRQYNVQFNKVVLSSKIYKNVVDELETLTPQQLDRRRQQLKLHEFKHRQLPQRFQSLLARRGGPLLVDEFMEGTTELEVHQKLYTMSRELGITSLDNDRDSSDFVLMVNHWFLDRVIPPFPTHHEVESYYRNEEFEQERSDDKALWNERMTEFRERIETGMKEYFRRLQPFLNGDVEASSVAARARFDRSAALSWHGNAMQVEIDRFQSNLDRVWEPRWYEDISQRRRQRDDAAGAGDDDDDHDDDVAGGNVDGGADEDDEEDDEGHARRLE